MKSIDDALEIRGRIFGAFEMAERETDPDKRREWLTFVIVGGGPTGVEMAGQIAELSHRSLHRNFRHFDPASARVVLLDAGDALIPAFGKRLSGKALSGLRKLGVEVHLNSLVTNVDADGIDAKAPDGSDAARRAPRRRSGPPGSRRRRWARCSATEAAPRSTARAG